MHVLVLGAGVVGVSTAWYLQQASHTVTVVDRQTGPGMEASFANGGQISVSHAEPWANPAVLPKLLQWIRREDAPLYFHWRWDPALFAWGLRFLWQCSTSRSQRNIRHIVALALYSRQQLLLLRERTGIEYEQLQKGILHLYTHEDELRRAAQIGAIMREMGCARYSVSAEECIRIEPALANTTIPLIGGDFTPEDESGDAYRFTQTLAARAAAAGVDFRYGINITRLEAKGHRICAVLAGENRLEADAYVLACGSESPRLLAPLGLSVPIYPAKGYSASIALSEESVAPIVSLTDDEHKIVFSRLGQRLRIAGTAEFNGYDLHLNPARCAMLMRRTQAWFPQLRAAAEPEFWCGLRPATPSNLPYIGRTPFDKLWLNTGHGTLGWTMACGSAAALTDLLAGRCPVPDFPFQ